MSEISHIAVDWGTTSFRLWVIDQSANVLNTLTGPFGMATLQRSDYEHVLEDSLASLKVASDVPVVICGMAGAAQGWCEAPYLSAPTHLFDVGRGAVRVRDTRRDIRILPGVKQTCPANVMRGEETQILGMLKRTPEFEGVVCLPGTHTKWVRVAGGELVEFTTCMTGEQFALLSQTSVLKHSMIVDGWDDEAFLGASNSAFSQPHLVPSKFFDLRAEMLLENLQAGAARARLSGLLVGAELAATRRYWKGNDVHLIGSAELCRNYQRALSELGVASEVADSEVMTLAGITAAFHEIDYEMEFSA